MGNGIARNFKFFTKTAFVSLFSTNAILAVVLLLQTTGGLYTHTDGLAEVVFPMYFFMGGMVMNFILFLQCHTSAIPMVIGLNTTRKAIFIADMIERVLVTLVEITIILGLIYFLPGEMSAINISQAGFTPMALFLSLFTALFFVACAGAFFGGLIQLFQKWGVAALVLFVICATVGIILFLLRASSVFTFGTSIKIVLVSMWLVVILFCISGYIMNKKYTAKG